MRKIITIAIFALSVNAFAQTLKSFTGDYPLSYPFIGQNGKATYKYYDDPITYSRIKNGVFTFNFKGIGDYAPVEISVTGNYKNNLKDGNWIVKQITKDFYSNGKYLSGTIICTVSYKEGVLNGTFKYTSSATSRKKTFNRATKQFEYSKPTPPETEKLEAKFRKDTTKTVTNQSKNILVGNFLYNMSDPNTNNSKSIIAKFDSLGFCIGKYTIKGSKNEKIIEFSDGSILTKYINRNSQSGEAEIKNICEDYETNIWNKFLLYSKNSPDSLKSLYNSYSFQYRNLSEGLGSDGYLKIKEILEQTFFMCKDIKGDVNYKDGSYNFDGFNYRKIVKQ